MDGNAETSVYVDRSGGKVMIKPTPLYLKKQYPGGLR
jgi:hypothetical protein